MFFKIAKFEFKYFLNQPSFYIISLLFFFLAFGAVASDIHFGASNANVNYNSPYAVSKLLIGFSFIGMFLVANFVGMSATRDFSHKMNGMIYAMPIEKGSYIWGRLFGVLGFSLLVFMFVPLGTFIGSFVPWLEVDRVGETYFLNFLSTYLIFVLPSFIFVSSLFYSFALLTRSMMGMYLGVVGFFILKALSKYFLKDPALETLASLLDPFANNTFLQVTKYWTAHDMNTVSIGLEELIWQNRLFWLVISALIIALTHFFINLRKLKKHKSINEKEQSLGIYTNILKIKQKDLLSSQWLRFRTRIKFETLQIVKSPAFIVLGLLTIFQLSQILFSGDFGTDYWPVTQNMAVYIMGSFSLLIVIIITYYGAESIWRERDIGIGEVIESTPSTNWSLFFPKLLAIFAVIVLLLIIGVIFTVSYQISKDYMIFEWDVYFILLTSIYLLPMFMMTVLSLLIQVVSPNKYVGMFVFAIYLIISPFLSTLGLEHGMWNFTIVPYEAFSDMNRLGHFAKPIFVYNLYWLGLTLVFLVLSYGLKNRGVEYGFKHRWSQLKTNIGKTGFFVLLFGSLLFVGMGYYIYHNTTILNKFYTKDQVTDLRVAYEKKYKQFEDLPMVKITDVNLSVDIYPTTRKVEANGYYIIKNKTASDINKTLIFWDKKCKAMISLKDGELKDIDKEYNTAWIHFDLPMKPDENRKINFSITKQNEGFVDRWSDTARVKNGTFIDNKSLLPQFGYYADMEITDKSERKKRGMTPAKRIAKLEDASKRKINYFSPDADFINYEATISTSIDQFAITPGYLQKEWTKDDRRYFHYKMDAPIGNFFAFQSGRYEVKKENHKGVSIEIYYHKTHDKNIQKMIEAVKNSLDIYSKEFSPYQHKQVRIIGFPNYRSFAQSFANTIPFSESMGFIEDLRDREKADKLTFVTAHEMGHQWWGHQIMPAKVQGGQVLSESMAEYSAYLVVKNIYGSYMLRKNLKRELDIYLRSRKSENLEEMPLLRAENQSYIHYFKGGIVMYSLGDRLGEKTFHKALRNFIKEFQYKSDPYPTTLDLVRHIKAVAQKSDYSFIDDMFEKITLFDLKMKSATAKKLDNGNYQVELSIEAEKYYADGKGKESKTELDDYFDIGIFASDPDKAKSDEHVLKFTKEHLRNGENKFIFEVKSLPKFTGVDPYHIMIDRNSDDNIIAVKLLD